MNLLDENGVKQIPFGEVIQVYDNMDSNGSVAFEASDFNSAPISPSGR